MQQSFIDIFFPVLYHTNGIARWYKISKRKICFKNKTRENLANNILFFRYKNNLSQEKLAEICNSSATYISAVENGKRNASADFIDSIANAFGIPSYEMLKEREKTTRKIRVDSKK